MMHKYRGLNRTGNNVNPAPYAESIKHEVLLLNAVEALTEAANHIQLNQTEATLVSECLMTLTRQLNLTEKQSRRLEDEYHKRLCSNRGLKPAES